MSRISACFENLRRQQRKALIPFITAGDPAPNLTVELMHTLVEAGGDIVELGVPFSDPMADGPVIQRASERALAHHVSLSDVLGMVRRFREHNQSTPVVLMGYLNPIEVMGYAVFAEAAQKAGADGVLIVDMPPEEAGGLLPSLKAHALDLVFLLAPTTNNARIERICQLASGFVYYVSLKGVTGSNKLDTTAVRERVTRIRQYTTLPIGVGFGIRDAASAASVAAISDAVVVGSALVNLVETLQSEPARLKAEMKAFVGGLRQAIDAV